jgi:hypothetical protein
MLVPDKLMNAEPRFILRVQSAMCEWEQATKGCKEQCALCPLQADLSVFNKWLINQLQESEK